MNFAWLYTYSGWHCIETILCDLNVQYCKCTCNVMLLLLLTLKNSSNRQKLPNISKWERRNKHSLLYKPICVVTTHTHTRTHYTIYCMAGNFRGWLGSDKIFPPMKINAYEVHDDGRGHKHCGSVANTFQYWQACTTVAIAIQLIASSTLSHAINLSKSLQVWLSYKEDRKHIYWLYYRLCSSATPLDWLLSRNLKLILRAFSDFPRKLPAIRYMMQWCTYMTSSLLIGFITIVRLVSSQLSP